MEADQEPSPEQLLTHLPYNPAGIHSPCDRPLLDEAPAEVIDPSSLVCDRCWHEIFSSKEVAKACWTDGKDDKNWCRYETMLLKVEESAS